MKKIQKVLLRWPSPFAFYPPSLFPYGQRTWENFSRMEKTSDIILFLVTFSQDWKININQEVLKKFTYKKANLDVFSIFKWWPLYSKHLKETDVTTVNKKRNPDYILQGRTTWTTCSAISLTSVSFVSWHMPVQLHLPSPLGCYKI